MLATMTRDEVKADRQTAGRDNLHATKEAQTRPFGGSALQALYATKSNLKDSHNDLRFFGKFCGCDTPEQIEALLLGPESTKEKTQDLVASYRDHLVSRGMAYGTINRRLTVVRTLVRLAKLVGAVKWEIDVPAGPKTKRRDTRGVSKRSLKAASRMVDDTPRARRDRAIVTLAHHAQLKRADVVSLLLEHYDPDPLNPSIEVAGYKMALTKKVKISLDAWVEVRGFKSGSLFTRIDDRTTPMTQDEIIVLVRSDSILGDS